MAFQRFSYLFDWIQMRPDSTGIRAHIMQRYLGQFYPSIEDEYMSRAEQSIQATDGKGPREQPQSLITEELIYNPHAFQSQNPINDWLPVSTQSLTNNPSTARLGSHAANEDGSSNGSESIEASLNQSFTRQGDSVIGTNHQPQPEINPLQLRDNSAESGMKTEPAVEAQGSTLKAKPDQRSGTGKVSQTLRRITEQSALSPSPSSPQKSDSHLLGTLTDNLNSYLIIKNNKIAIEGVALSNTNQLVSDLMAIGLEDASVYGNSFTGMMPLSSLSQLEAQKKLGYVRAVLKPATNSDSDQAVLNSGLAISEGDKAQRSDVARLKYGTSGNGVTVGVLSDSFNARNEASADIASGDLPQSGVKVLRDIADGSDEGRAMLQIIHDVAPGANLAFHTAFLGQVSFALGIKNLANPLTQGGAGARVIVDDVFYFAEPFFQDGIIAQAVNEVASDGNVSYFSSAGNRADKSYEASWNPGRTQSGYSWHDFNPDTQQADFLQDITVLPGREFTIAFQWDEPFASASITGKGSANDLDIFFFASNDPTFGSQDPDFDSLFSNNLITESIDANINGDPFEFISVRNNGDVAATGYLAVGQFLGIGGGGPAPGRIKYVDLGSRSNVVEYATNSSTSFGHNQAALGLGVAAADYRNTPEFGVNPPQPESFTSLGGTPLLFDVSGNRLSEPLERNQPGITAPDGVSTTVPGFASFFGTSAAAPSAAAVAALILEKVPTATNQQIYNAMKATAIDMASPGFDLLTGAGLIQADAAIAWLLTPSITLSVSTDSVTEDGSTNLIYTFKRTGDTSSPLTVNYTVSGTARLRASASDPADYTGILLPGAIKSVTFAKNSDTATVAIDPISDLRQEDDETVSLSLADGFGYTIETPNAVTGAILNDDLIGNSRANILTGSARSEFIDGRGGRDRLTGGLGPDVFAFRFRESTLALPDRITDFEIGMDKIDIFSARGVDLPQPVAFSRAADNSTAATLNQLSTAVFSDANGALPGSQRLAANAAALVVATNPAIQGTYLVINDSTLRSETGNDMLINITGYTGVLPALGVIQSSDIFM